MAKKQILNTGKGNEPFWKSRRIWGAVLSGVVLTAILIAPEQYDLIIAGASGVAGILGLTSWVKPIKK